MSTIVHFELAYENRDRIKAFYDKAFDWKYETDPTYNYDLVYTKEDPEGFGINGGLQGENEYKQKVILTIDVSDINMTLAKIEENGGTVLSPIMDMPSIGKILYFKDPEGNIMSAMESAR
jgi:hypothetical protein